MIKKLKSSNRQFLILSLCMLGWVTTYAQDLITINTQSNTIVLQVNKDNELNTIYFGSKLNDEKNYEQLSSQYRQGTDYTNVYNSIYTPSGTKNLLEPAINVTHFDGNKSLSLQFEKVNSRQLEENISQTEISLKDPAYDLEVNLYFKAYFKEDIIEQWVSITNKEKGEITLHKYASANLYLQGADDFWLRQYHGDWAKEMQPEEQKLTHGIQTLDSKLGTRANLFQPSVFMISFDQPSEEDNGKVLFGGLEWSGNFRTDLEMDPLNNLRVISGINNYNSDYKLAEGEKFETPKFWFTLSEKGKGLASRNIHDWARKYKILEGEKERLTLLNNWEATYFDFNEEKLKKLIRDAKELGVDLFLLDDGWFGNDYPRNGDNAGLGDWEVNQNKLPNGIGTLVQTASENDVKFGIWIEPEMINPDSNLYQKHPDWIIRQSERPEHYFRNQLVLDLSNPEVQDFVYEVVDELFTNNPKLAYIKWDCNAVIYNAYSDFLGADQSQLYVDYVNGLYDVLSRIRKKYPNVPMMLCSGGGGRVDYGALKYFTEFWPSDNTDPLERVFMQWEYSYFYPAVSMSAHVTNWGKQSIKYKTDVAMTGKLGFDIVLEELNAKELEFCKKALENYNQLENTIWQGDQYRLQDPYEHDAASTLFVNKSGKEAVLFTFLTHNRYESGTRKPIKLKGLDASKNYHIEEINIYPGNNPSFKSDSYSGDFLMKIGVNPNVQGSQPSVILKLTAEN